MYVVSFILQFVTNCTKGTGYVNRYTIS